MKGVYKICFSNEFSTFSHKTVYLEFSHGEEQPLLQSMQGPTALTQVSLRTMNFTTQYSKCVCCSEKDLEQWPSLGHSIPIVLNFGNST